MVDRKQSWILDFTNGDFLIIAGPCSAESRQQVIETADELKISGQVSVFRAGLWKPRTRPGSFEGVGVTGFDWLRDVKEKTGLHIAVEAASPVHVEECLKNEVDIIWIGARTTSNPFSVQELAKSLSGTDIPVLVKNPLHPDLSLWIGAIERFENAGLKRIGAVHRGFFPYSHGNLRNLPRWDLLIEIKRLLPELPVISDPSHIAGNTRHIHAVAQKAIDLEVQGLMVEVHAHPTDALSDSKQQFSPVEFRKFLAGLHFRRTISEEQEFLDQLQEYRSKIDMLDHQILEFLQERMKINRDIGELKCRSQITILQMKRWEEILQTRTEWASKLGFSEEFTLKLLQVVHEEAIRVQSEIMNRCRED